MPTTSFHTALAVAVHGGALTVAVAGPGAPGVAPVVLGLHGTTGSHHSLAAVAPHLAARDITFLVPDLRGRGTSAGLPGPYGLEAHVVDVMAVLDHWGAERVVLAGHSLGAWVAARAAAAHPQRCAGVVLIDGGLSPRLPGGIDPDAVIDSVLGPALTRLRMTFASRQHYRDFWRRHPAFANRWNADIADFVDHDLIGPPGALRSRVVEAAVRVDGRDVLDATAAWAALAAIAGPVVLLRAPRGLADEPSPLIPKTLVDQAKRIVPRMGEVLIDDTNHYLIVFGAREAAAVAGEIARLTAAVA
jgi:lipase